MQVWDQSAKAVSSVLAARWVLWSVISFTLFLGIACAQAALTDLPTPTPTPAPTPTPTPTPAPTLTPTPASTPTPSPLPAGSAPPLVEFEPDFNADPDPEKLVQMLRLIGVLPEGYSRMVVVDVKGLAQTAALAQAVDLGDLGLPRMLQPLLTYALDLLVLAVPDAVPDAGNGAVVIFQGPVDLGSLVALASGLGMEIDPEPEIYQGHRLWSGQIFGSTALSLADLGGNIGVIAQGPVTDLSVPEQLVKDVLDGADGPTLVPTGGPVFWSLVGKLSSGPITVLADECRSLATLYSAIAFIGCASSAVTVIEASEDQVLAHLVLGFGTEVQAEAALPMLREGLANSEIGLREIAVRQEGTLLRARMAGNTQKILSALTGEN